MPAEKYEVLFLCGHDSWLRLAMADRRECIPFRPNLWQRIVRRLILAMPAGDTLWRALSRYVSPLHRLIWQHRPDLVVYSNNEPHVYEATWKAVAPVFDLMHRYESQFPEVGSKEIFNERERHYRLLCRHAAAIVVDSEVGKKQLMESYGYEADKIYVLPYVAPPYAQSPAARATKPKTVIPVPYLFYPAKFWRHKNHINLVRALDMLVARGHDLHLVMSGARDNGYTEVVDLVETLGLDKRTVILPYVSDEELVWLYTHAFALVMPTSFGPTNIPPLEAFALGCPVIASDIYGMPEQVGNAALLVNPLDPQDIADKIRMLADDPLLRDQLIARGLERARAWGPAQFGESFESIVRSVLSTMS